MLQRHVQVAAVPGAAHGAADRVGRGDPVRARVDDPGDLVGDPLARDHAAGATRSGAARSRRARSCASPPDARRRRSGPRACPRRTPGSPPAGAARLRGADGRARRSSARGPRRRRARWPARRRRARRRPRRPTRRRGRSRSGDGSARAPRARVACGGSAVSPPHTRRVSSSTASASPGRMGRRSTVGGGTRASQAARPMLYPPWPPWPSPSRSSRTAAPPSAARSTRSPRRPTTRARSATARACPTGSAPSAARTPGARSCTSTITITTTSTSAPVRTDATDEPCPHDGHRRGRRQRRRSRPGRGRRGGRAGRR